MIGVVVPEGNISSSVCMFPFPWMAIPRVFFSCVRALFSFSFLVDLLLAVRLLFLISVATLLLLPPILLLSMYPLKI